MIPQSLTWSRNINRSVGFQLSVFTESVYILLLGFRLEAAGGRGEGEVFLWFPICGTQRVNEVETITTFLLISRVFFWCLFKYP